MDTAAERWRATVTPLAATRPAARPSWLAPLAPLAPLAADAYHCSSPGATCAHPGSFYCRLGSTYRHPGLTYCHP
eukprot:scaffold25193_cov60-Phaeocystis_antarctica.AAC.1